MLILEGEQNPEENPRSTREINYGNSTHMKHPSRPGYRFFAYNMSILDGEKNPEENPRSTREINYGNSTHMKYPSRLGLGFSVVKMHACFPIKDFSYFSYISMVVCSEGKVTLFRDKIPVVGYIIQ